MQAAMDVQGVIGRTSIFDGFSGTFPIDGGFTNSFNNCCMASIKFSDSLCYNSVVSRRFGVAGLTSRKRFNSKHFNPNKFGGSINIRGEIDESDRVATPAEPRESFLLRSQTHALLKQQMRVAALSEDYKEAARIRDSLKLLEDQEPALRLQSLLKKAISEERFEDAAHYRNELQLIAPDALLKCFSDTTTLGIRVQVRSIYVSGRSQPSKGQYFFAYRIRISNLSNRPVQLLRRHWSITDTTGKTEHIWGVGVIGEQPVVLPRTSFEYSSACPLGTATGRMEGDFEMKHVDKVNSDTFSVLVAAFALSVDSDDDAT